MRLLFVLVVISALFTGHAAAKGELEQRSVAAAIVGPWRLVEWVVTDQRGEQVYPFGRTPDGLLIYTANGQMSVQLMDPT